MLLNLARKLSLWHSIDRKNRLQILHGQPLFGLDLRQAVEVKLVCNDIFEAKRFKYINWKQLKQRGELVPSDSMFSMAQAVFNPAVRYNSEVK
jgi:hypothetical protein